VSAGGFERVTHSSELWPPLHTSADHDLSECSKHQLPGASPVTPGGTHGEKYTTELHMVPSYNVT
jgi:hypothetical protein